MYLRFIDLMQVIGLSISMFVCTFLIGYMPLFFQFKNQTCINKFSVFGAGLLVGAAFLLIIPEGIMVLISSKMKEVELKKKLEPIMVKNKM